MRIESNYSRPHGMRIRVIRIESGLHESTSTGGLNTNWLQIGMLRHNNAAREGLTRLHVTFVNNTGEALGVIKVQGRIEAVFHYHI